MKYQSKKDPEVTAYVDFEEEKYGTVMMIYLSGPNKGKSFSITKSTLKRWWKVINEENSAIKFEDTIDFEQVNKPYKPEVKRHYIPKPQSVIDYENNKKKGYYNFNLPNFEEIVENLGSKAIKVNENSSYLKFEDKSTLWRKNTRIDIYASEELGMKLAESGLKSSVNKDKDRPFAFKIEGIEEYNKMLEVLECE